jgi:hypothetical protein
MRFAYVIDPLLAVMFLVAASPLTAQSVDKKAASAASPCTDADFWIGEWNITDAKGAKEATASIKHGLSHCSVTEDWSSEKTSERYFCFMAYSNDKHGWDYLCSSSNPGARLRYTEGVLEGDEFKFVQLDLLDGAVHHFSYLKLPHGHIRELAVGSSDGGKTWKTEYDAMWERKK